jgi:hypothetical protein
MNNLEVKGNLARLLAQENLIVEHAPVETASFDVERRLLTLPNWKKASNVVFDLLVSHEVGHALYTPNEDWTDKLDCPMSYVNIVEDARVEKLMKRRYQGLSKTFYSGYKELSDQDFFCIQDQNLDEMNFADRVNLWFKIGNYVNVPIINKKEKEIIDMVSEAETFADVLIISDLLYKFCKESEETKEFPAPKNEDNKQNGQPGPSDTNSDQKNDSDEESENESEENKESDEIEKNSGGGNVKQSVSKNKSQESIDRVKTDEKMNEGMKEFADTTSSRSVYVELPKIELDKCIVSHEKVIEDLNAWWNQVYPERNHFDHIDQKYDEYKKSSQKEVNYLVKEFECKKSANNYARATTSRTGVLDCTKLHTYKYNEDLFKKITIIPDGKSHGLIFVLDWSGSMGEVLVDTVKQLFNLVWFCKKVNIPFDVFAFTNSFYQKTDDARDYLVPSRMKKGLFERKPNEIYFDSDFRMIQVLTSDCKKNKFDDMCKTFWRLAFSCSKYYAPEPPVSYQLSGTPLNESIIVLNEIIPNFLKNKGIQKVQCVILTDGESNAIGYNRPFTFKGDDGLGVGIINGSNIFLRDRKLGTTYEFGWGYDRQVKCFLLNLQDRFPDVNIIGIRICGGSEFNKFCSIWMDDYDKIDKVRTLWKKQKSVSLNIQGFTKYIAMSSNSIQSDSEFVVSEDASKSQIRNAFKKSLSSSKLNKKILSEFVEMIA